MLKGLLVVTCECLSNVSNPTNRVIVVVFFDCVRCYAFRSNACEVVSAIVYKLTIKHDEIKGLLDIVSSIEIKFFFNVVICIVGEIGKVPIDIHRNVWVLASIIYRMRCLL